MRSRLLRALLTFAAFVAAWFVVGSAQAAQVAPVAPLAPVEASPVDVAGGVSRGVSRAVSRDANASFVGTFESRLAPSPKAPENEPLGSRAPLCDRRGAITFASAPQMQDLEVSLDTGLTAEDCLSEMSSGRSGRASRGRAPLPIDASSASGDAAVITAVATFPPSGRERLPAPAVRATRARPGIRSTVDRPPRA